MNEILLCLLFSYFIIINIHLFRMFFSRRDAAQSGKIKASFFKAYEGDCPDYLKVIGNHTNNQFQMPMIFFVVGTLAITMNTVSYVTIALAALFIISRILHSMAFLGANNVLNRAKYYAVGLLVLNVMWGEVIVRAICNKY